MITRIELTNFMSHAHTVIEPAAGLTVLVGANNVGKSAVVAALQILARNGPSTYVMRHGAKECSVRVETDDGHVVQWRRKNDSPNYIINGQTFDRLKKCGIPEELHRALRLPPVDAGGDDKDVDMHFGEQKSPIFLLDKSESVAARFFASSSDAIRLVEIQRRHKDKHAQAKRDKVRLDGDSQRVNNQLEILAPVVDLNDRLVAIENLHDEVLQLRSRLIEAHADASDLATQSEQLAEWQAHTDVLSRLPLPPSLFPVTPLAELIADLRTAQRDFERTESQVTALSAIEQPPSMYDVVALEDLASKLLQQASEVKRSTAIQQSLALLTGPPTILPTDSLWKTVTDFERATKQQSVATTRSDMLGRLAAPPELHDEADLQHQLIELMITERHAASWAAQSELLYTVAPPPLPADTLPIDTAVSQLEAALCDEQTSHAHFADAMEELEEVARELRELAVGSQCRLCGSPLDPDRVLALAATGLGGHAHE